MRRTILPPLPARMRGGATRRPETFSNGLRTDMSGNWHKRGNIRGADGVGVPTGGQPGQALQKVGNSDFATAWANLDYADLVGKVPKSALPDIGNSTTPVASEAAMLNLPAVVGNMAIRTDIGKTFVLAEEPANVLENWVELVTSSDVQSVNGKTGNVTLTKADVGLSNVSNTADSDKPVATTSVNGLMSKADKSKLDKATSSGTSNTIVERNANNSFQVNRIFLGLAPSNNNEATTKEYVDAQVSSVAGGSVLSNTDWDAMRTTASTGVVEGWVKGCPIGGKLVGNMSAGFVIDPVWKLEVRPEGLNYVTQRATLLNCTPKFMIGFAWERIYDPAEAKWSAWTCVGGDTGIIRSVSKPLSTLAPDEPLVHRDVSGDGGAVPYVPGNPLAISRSVGRVSLSGAMRGFGPSLSTTSGNELGWFALSTDPLAAGTPGSDYTLFWVPDICAIYGVQQGSSTSHWSLEESGHGFFARRYGPATPSPGGGGSWLPFSVSYQVPQINTYTGPGFAPPAIPVQSGTMPS